MNIITYLTDKISYIVLSLGAILALVNPFIAISDVEFLSNSILASFMLLFGIITIFTDKLNVNQLALLKRIEKLEELYETQEGKEEN